MGELEAALNTSTVRVEAENESLPGLVVAKLEEDDRMLRKLEEQGQGLDASIENVQEEKRASDLLSLLSKCTARSVRKHLDITYLKALNDSSAKTVHGAIQENPDDAERLENLQREIDSLYPDIDTLVDVNIDHQFRKPLMVCFSDQRKANLAESKAKLSQVGSYAFHY